MDDTAKTMVSELISSTNELTDVNGMSNTSLGPMSLGAMRPLLNM